MVKAGWGYGLCAAALCWAAGSAAAQPIAPVAAEGAWVRTSVSGQKATGAFMKLTARERLQLVGVASPAAGHGELHEMKMDGDVMKMRAVPALDLGPGQPLELKPGGYHVMLFDLKTPLARGNAVPLTLTFRDARGATSRLELSVPVGVIGPPTADSLR